MSGPRSLDVPGEGTVFGVPLADDGFALGIVIRRSHPRVVRIGLMTKPVTELPLSPSVLTRGELGLLTQVQSRALDDGRWPVVGVMENYKPEEWPNPPMLPGDRIDKGDSPERLERHIVDIVRHHRKRALQDRTWVAEHPEFADPVVGTHYMRLPMERIRPFVEERLTRSSTLARTVIDRVNLDEGDFICTLPEEVGVEKAVANPRGGGISYDRGRNLIRGHLVLPDGIREPVFDNRFSAMTMISEWLRPGTKQIGIYWDPFGPKEMTAEKIAQASDRWAARGGAFRTFSEECYVILRPGGAADPATRDFLVEHDWSKVGFLTSHERVLDGAMELTQHDFSELADNLEAIVIGAYDGEGYIVWTRTNGDRWLVG